MLTRILGITKLNNLPRYILWTQRLAAISKISVIQTPKYLHVKTYDKDVRQGSQRETRNWSNLDEQASETDHTMLPKNSTIKYMNDNEKEIYNKTLLNPVELKSVSSKEDPDVFGSSPIERISEDEGDIKEEEYISRPTRHSKKLKTKEYALMIKEHLNQHQLKEAIDVLQIRMLKEDRVKPENYIYNLLISGCAKAGYTRKAFRLFTEMRQRGLKVKQSTYTSLFNACANAPSRQDGLTRAIRLRESLLENGYEFNVKNYNVMIKTFGRWGDVKTAYILADEMQDKKLEMTGETFNFLLQACASDEKHGFRHCLLTWHKMLKKRIVPDYYSFNTILRCVRDCGFGDLEDMENALQHILSTESVKLAPEKGVNSGVECIPDSAEHEKSSSVAVGFSSSDNSLQIPNETTSLQLPNLLAPVPHLGSMVKLSEVQKPHERFLLLGGLTGFLELMKSRNITPDIETFTTMLEVIPPTNTAEKQLLTFIRKIGLKADIDFFNILIKKRAMRFDYEGGKEVLSMIRTAGLYPDIVTYGVLALGCTTVESSRELLEQMRRNGIRMNIQILGAMLKQGCFQKSFPYICEIMQISLDENIKPNEPFLRHLHNFYLYCARGIDARHPTTKTKSFRKDHKKFCDKYRLYQEEHGIDGLKLEDAIKKIKERPYDHYKEDKFEGMEPLKNEKLARKQKLRKYIKKIKLQSLKGDDDINETNLLHSSNEKSDERVTSSEKVKNYDEAKKLTTNNPFRTDSL